MASSSKTSVGQKAKTIAEGSGSKAPIKIEAMPKDGGSVAKVKAASSSAKQKVAITEASFQGGPASATNKIGALNELQMANNGINLASGKAFQFFPVVKGRVPQNFGIVNKVSYNL
jgi:hypothetical protein